MCITGPSHQKVSKSTPILDSWTWSPCYTTYLYPQVVRKREGNMDANMVFALALASCLIDVALIMLALFCSRVPLLYMTTISTKYYIGKPSFVRSHDIQVGPFQSEALLPNSCKKESKAFLTRTPFRIFALLSMMVVSAFRHFPPMQWYFQNKRIKCFLKNENLEYELVGSLRVCLDYYKEIHQSRISKGWRNMIG